MTIWYKAGVMGTLTIPARKGFGRVVKLYANEGLNNFYVTSIQEGNHGYGSLHPDGNSFDFKKQGVSIKKIRKVLGNDFQVINEGNHLHAEYDPPKDI